MNKILSVIIPSYKDPLLQKTIDSLLETSKLGDQLEIIPVLDGYWPNPQLKNDNRVVVLHKGKNEGMREAINSGIRISSGKYIMRTDEHCMYADGFDKAMLEVFQPHWIMTAKRFFLDPVKWEVMDKEPVIYEKLKVRDLGNNTYKFEGRNWKSREEQRKHKDIDETMAMQGSMWIMERAWWDKVIGELDTKNYGTMYQDSHEMVFKTWKAKGKLVVNKKTWFAHKHVSFPRTHHYSRSEWEQGVKYAYETWIDYYKKEIQPKWKV